MLLDVDPKVENLASRAQTLLAQRIAKCKNYLVSYLSSSSLFSSSKAANSRSFLSLSNLSSISLQRKNKTTLLACLHYLPVKLTQTFKANVNPEILRNGGHHTFYPVTVLFLFFSYFWNGNKSKSPFLTSKFTQNVIFEKISHNQMLSKCRLY